MFVLLGVLCLLQTASLVPAQLITLRDGQVGVNFAGYHAAAGLGGLLTGNSAHGGLSASAGTPWGSRAASGLGGNLDGRTSGLGYAAAQANPSVGASAVLGGSVGEQGYIGAEAHSPGKTVISSKQHSVQPAVPVDLPSPTSAPGAPLPTASSHIQKVKPPKKYSLIRPDPDHSDQIIENHAKATGDGAAVDKHQLVAAAPAESVIIVKRPRLRVKHSRPRPVRQRTVYVMQQQIPQQQEQELGHQDEQQPLVEVPVKSEAKVVQAHKYKSVQRTQGVNNRFIAPQAQGPVGLALDIPIGILRSLQQSLGALTSGAVHPQQQQPAAVPAH